MMRKAAGVPQEHKARKGHSDVRNHFVSLLGIVTEWHVRVSRILPGAEKTNRFEE